MPSAFGVVAPEPLEYPTEDGSDEPDELDELDELKEPPDGWDEPAEKPADPPPDVSAGLGSGSGSGVSPDWGEPVGRAPRSTGRARARISPARRTAAETARRVRRYMRFSATPYRLAAVDVVTPVDDGQVVFA